MGRTGKDPLRRWLLKNDLQEVRGGHVRIAGRRLFWTEGKASAEALRQKRTTFVGGTASKSV